MNKLVFALIILLCGVGNVSALTIETVNLGQTSANAGSIVNRMSPVVASSDSYLNIINIVNDYLWFALAPVCVGTLVYVGFKLMTAQGDKAKMQQANRALVGIVIGLGIAYFSYTIIRIVANRF